MKKLVMIIALTASVISAPAFAKIPAHETGQVPAAHQRTFLPHMTRQQEELWFQHAVGEPTGG